MNRYEHDQMERLALRIRIARGDTPPAPTSAPARCGCGRILPVSGLCPLCTRRD